MASTVAHDSHHMIVVGTNHGDMARAANRLSEVGGGVVMISQGEELGLVEMPIAGLMSDERAEIVAAKADILTAAMREMGCSLNNAYMQHSLLALVVIPELRISDLGLVEMTRKRIGEGLLESVSTGCFTCDSNGLLFDDSLFGHRQAIPGPSVSSVTKGD